MLEQLRLRVRGLVQFLDRAQLVPVYTDFEDVLNVPAEIDVPDVQPGVDLDCFRSRAEAYLRAHLDHVALERLRRNRQLTPGDLTALEDLLVASGAGAKADIGWCRNRSGGLGLFMRGLVGLHREATVEAFAGFLDEGRFDVNQIRFVNLIVDELTKNGVVEPARLFESPYIDHALTGPDLYFPYEQVESIVATLRHIKQTAVPDEVA